MKKTDQSANKKSYLYRSFFFIISVFCTLTSFGQTKNELSYYVQSSFSNLDYSYLGQQSESGVGVGLGARFAYYLTDHWSISTGAELHYMDTSINLSSVEGAYDSQDIEGEAFEFRFRAEDFSENQYTYFAQIPIQVQYETRGTTRFYAAGGAKVGFMLSSVFQSDARSLVTSGYYSQNDVELNGPEFVGFGSFDGIGGSGSTADFSTNFILSVESGIKLMAKKQQSFYIGLFLDYGLSSIQPSNLSNRFVPYNAQAPTPLTFNSLLSSTKDNAQRTYVDEIRTFAFGLKIQYAFQF